MLKLNHNKMGTLPKGRVNEWYTANFNEIFNIHVHNVTKNHSWAFKFLSIGHKKEVDGFHTKEDAYLSALTYSGMFISPAKHNIDKELENVSQNNHPTNQS